GSHVHETLSGKRVYIWRRGDTYLARGRWNRRQFGETLGNDQVTAAHHLRRLLNAIEDGGFRPPSEARLDYFSDNPIPRLSFTELANEFLTAKRKEVGAQTAGDYGSRLIPLTAFAELPVNRKRWPLAVDIDTAFVTEARAYLHTYRTTRNGRSG